METIMTVSGMHCKSCTLLIKEALEEVDGVTRVSVSLNEATVRVTHAGSVTRGMIEEIVNGQGFRVKNDED